MNRPNTHIFLAAGLVAGVALSLAGLQATQAETTTVAVQISTDGEATYAEGCADCHDGAAVATVGALLETLGHPDVSDDTEVLPADCSDCHSEEGGMWLLSEVAHMSHYREPAENKFVQEFGGDCRHCHVMDGETGEAGVKSGPKNW
ncbi:hypothetical protein [Thioalkalivibrio sp. XN279]|uniref:hypothetical protein n=1 Tax=Thioalkalivibrio sp. XN279 TaxID=2714953 RepID=UPI00140996E2|nr:hypothetical protein [Thioalkalivibrio sp. XN279]NHA16159.1 hypothetical protein [Thioalkalivibrio sp. XN279]